MNREITISDEFIRLGQALKLAGIAQTGIEAKIMVTSGGVKVNGETETRRGRKLRDGDRVEAEGGAFTVRGGMA
ncbi:MAG: RNA-binding S4 domain-containing protein [Lachnospiraceae bacterium]|jgi:ribosome-associated protein|nr:RNA-binding S4 domain-containing protein [Lachnospiraceae bacterium]MDO4408762.1 RNA-binding S4 domain-containing protein [Eubacteriales bacterium]